MNESYMAALGVPETATLNESFLREVMAWIRVNPERWNQDTFMRETACGTSHCLGGWAYVLGTGKQWPVTHEERWGSGEDAHQSAVVEAAALLGFNARQAGDIFHFISVWGGPRGLREVTFADLCRQVEKVTGVKFKAGVDYDEDTYG